VLKPSSLDFFPHSTITTYSHLNMSGLQLTLQTSPTRPKHQSNRSITEITGSSFPKIHRPHHHHPHQQHHHLHKNKDEAQSAHPSLGYSDPRAAGWGRETKSSETGSSSVPASRRESLLIPSSGDDGSRSEREGGKERRREVREGEVEKEKERGVLRAT
jgi:hypothetical protein